MNIVVIGGLRVFARTRVYCFETCEGNVLFGNQGLSSYSEETKKVRFFVIRSQLKKLSKSNYVHVHNKTFLAVRN